MTSVWDGTTANPATVYHKASTGTNPATMSPVNHGYPSVTDMLSGPFEIAHRGGGYTEHEMTLQAYTQSVLRDYGALEISVGRTSDGVWFGLHDSGIDRTSEVSLGVAASTMTWAQVQAYQVTLNPSGGAVPAQPYMLLNDLLDAYGNTHVLFFDIKNAGTYTEDALDLILAKVPPHRIVGKGFITSSSWAIACAARGITTWGYAYDTSMAEVVTHQSNWDLLGFNQSASQADWDTMLTYGKPVIGHVLTSQSNADDAMAKGASGLMVSNTDALIRAIEPPPNNINTFFNDAGTQTGGVTIANSANSGDAFTDLPYPSDDLGYTTGRIGSGFHCIDPADTRAVRCGWEDFGNQQTTAAIGFWYKPNVLNALDRRIVDLSGTIPAGANNTIGGVVLSPATTGALRVMSRTSAAIDTESPALTAGLWYWVSAFFDSTTGECTIDIKNNDGSAFHSATNMTGFTDGHLIHRARFGRPSSDTPNDAVFDDLKFVQGATGVLEPTNLAPDISSDDFTTLDTNLWTVQDTIGQGTVSANGVLTLDVPDTYDYSAWHTDNSLGIFQDIPDVNFSVQAHFLSQPSGAYQGMGLMAKTTAGDWVMVSIYSNASNTNAFSVKTVSGSSDTQDNDVITSTSETWIKMTRSGVSKNTWALEHSSDGTNWTTYPLFTAWMTISKVGVVAYNSNSGPAFNCQVEDFTVLSIG